jgi:dTDP-4-dehydrorhamnose reductase
MPIAKPNMRVLTTGLNGLIGSKLNQVFGGTYDFENLDVLHPTQPVDITDYDQIIARFESAPEAKQVVHFAAYTDVTGAWNQRDDKTGPAYKVNVEGTKNLIKACAVTGKHLIHISTAYVFDGEKAESYVETDALSPIEWYGQTKAWAEEAVQSSDIPWTILRIDMPFRSDAFPRVDYAHRVIKGMVEGKLYPQFNNHYVGPTFIDDFVKVIDFVIRTNTTGLFHASSGEKWTDYDFAKTVNEKLQLGFEVKPGDLNAYLATLDRPYQKNTSLNCNKLQSILDFKQKTVVEAIQAIQKPWLITE